MSKDIVSGGVIELKGKRYSVFQFNKTLRISVKIDRWAGLGMIRTHRSLDSKGPTFKAVAAAYWAQKGE